METMAHTSAIADGVVEVPCPFLDVQYNGAAHPLAQIEGLTRGANCERFVFELLKHFCYEVGPMRSSELWEDRLFTRRVPKRRPLDILMFKPHAGCLGSSSRIYLGSGPAIHLSKSVGEPAIWEVEDFSSLKPVGCCLGSSVPFVGQESVQLSCSNRRLE
jgi:hypothetical protein